MGLDDLKAFVIDCIMGDIIADRDTTYAHNMSMMGQVDEISSSRHLQMNNLEFYEAVARLADVISPIPYSYTVVDEDKWPIDLRINLDISIKLESLLVELHKR